MKKFSVLMFLVFVLISIAGFSQRTIPTNPGPGSCYGTTNMLWTTQPWANSITVHVSEINVTFHTNEVCNASSYTWTVGNEASITTTGPSLTVDGNDLLWLPAGGCDDYNDNWESDNPAFNPDYPGGWLGSYPTGTYHTTMSVRSNLTSAATLPLSIEGAEFCSDGIGEIGGGIGG